MTLRLGITGGIGSGKSYISRRLERDFGVPVYDCDARAKALMHESAPLRQSLMELAGPEVYLPDGSLNRPFLATYLFASSSHVAAVNALVHPAVKADFLAWAEHQSAHRLVGMESAILFESGFRDVVDAVLVVEAPRALRLQRAMARDGATAAQIEARMQQQLSDAERRAQADYLLCNDGVAPLRPQLQAVLQSLCPSED